MRFRRAPAGLRPAAPTPEDPLVRQFRFVLRTAQPDAVEGVTREAFESLAAPEREAVLRVIQERLVAGMHLGCADTKPMARLAAAAERRLAGSFLQALPVALRHRVAAVALETEAAFGLLTGYAAWDGADPPAPEIDPGSAGFEDQGWHRVRAPLDVEWNAVLAGHASGGVGFGI